MALGERFRGGGTRGIARFLADHQHCDAGFDVRREDEPGTGRLRITCLGCGQTIEYRAAEAGELAAAGLDLNGPNGDAPAAVEPVAPVPHPAPVAAPTGAPPPAGRPGPRPQPTSAEPYHRRLPGWIPVLLIAALILGGLAMIAIGLTRSENDETGSNVAAQQAETQPAPPQNEASESEPTPAAPAPESGEGSPDGEAPAGGSVALDERTFLGRFEIGVPAGWDTDRSEDAVVLTARGGVAAVRVVPQRGEFSDSALAQGAAAFLAEEHPGARVGSPDRVRLGGHRATRVRATHRSGTATAFALSAGGFAFLISERVERGASAEIEDAADGAVASFRPR